MRFGKQCLTVARGLAMLGLLGATSLGCEGGPASPPPAQTSGASRSLGGVPAGSTAFVKGAARLSDGTVVWVDASGVSLQPVGARRVTFITRSIGRAGVTQVGSTRWRPRDHRSVSVRHGDVEEVLEHEGDHLEQSWHFEKNPAGEGDLVVHVEVTGLGDARRERGGVVFGKGAGAVGYSDGILISATGERFDVVADPVPGGLELRVPAHVLEEVVFPAVLDPIIGPATLPFTRARFSLELGYGPVQLVWSGTEYYAIAARSTPSLAYRFIRVDEDGDALAVATTVTGLLSSCVAMDAFWSGTEVILFCQTGAQVFVNRIGTNGALLSSTGLGVGGTEPTVTRGSSGYLVAWTAGAGAARNIEGIRLDTEAEPLDVTPLGIATSVGAQFAPTAASTASGYLVAYTDDRFTDAPTDDVRITAIDGDGNVLNTAGDTLFGAAAVDESEPRLFDGGGRLLLTHLSGDHSVLQELAPDGTRVGSPRSLTTTLGVHRAHFRDGAFQLRVGSTAAGHIRWFPSSDVLETHEYSTRDITYLDAAWNDTHVVTLAADTGLRTYTSDNDDAASAVSTLLEYEQTEMAGQSIVSNGEMYGMVHVSATFQFSTLDPAGTVLDGSDYLDGYTSTPTTTLTRARVEAAGDEFYVARSYGTIYVYFYRYAADGTRIVNRLRNFTATDPRLSWDGTALAVFYEGQFMRQVEPNGSTGAEITVSSAAGGTADITADAFDGVHLAAWTDFRNSATTGSDIYALRILTDGTHVDQNAILIADQSGAESRPEVTATDSGWLVSWRTPSGGLGVRSVSADGTAGATQFHTHASPVFKHVVAWGGTRALVVTISDDETLTGRLLDASGATVEGPFDLGLERPAARVSSVASVGQDDFLVAYDSYVPLARSEQLFVRRVSVGVPRGTACTDSAECHSGFCVDGVCCNTECGNSALDCQACSTASGALIEGNCTLAAAESVCRASVHECDLAETCSGTTAECPADAWLPGDEACNETPDSGMSQPDAGMGQHDAGMLPSDMGMRADAGDAGNTPDVPSGGGCSIASTPRTSEPFHLVVWASALLALGGRIMRRRRPRGEQL